MKRLLGLFLALSFVLTMLAIPSVAGAEETYTKTYEIETPADFATAQSEINAAEGGTYLISLKNDITLTGANSGARFQKNTVTIDGNNHTITGTGTFYLEPSSGNTVEVNVKNAIFQGGETPAEPGLFYVLQGGTLNFYDGVVLKDQKIENYFGGGVQVQSGTFNMYGGTIQNCGVNGGSVCYGGGVAVIGGGTFTMNGGTITGCYATTDYVDDYDPNRCFAGVGGGVFVSQGSTFTMNGGTISNNNATNFGGGVALDISYGEQQSQGMGNPKSAVIINGGTISGNTAGNGAGVYASGYFYSYADAIAAYAPGPGTPSNPGLYLKGGEISGNTAEESGGGVFIAMLRPAQKVQLHNATIKNNTAMEGAGVEVFGYWTQTDIDGAIITGNRATESGGGIMLSSNSSNGYTNLKNSTVTGNISGEIGAGVYYDGNSRLNISGVNTIENNTYNGKLNNLNILNKSKPVYVNGDLTGSQIGLSDPELWANSDDSAGYLTSGYKTNNASVVPSDVFTSDHQGWHADFSDVSGKENEVRLVKENPTYTLYDLDGTPIVDTASYDPSNPTSFDDHSKDGYQFIGWADEEGNLQTGTPGENLGHKEYHAIYLHSVSDNGFCHYYGIAQAKPDSEGVIAISTRVDNYKYVLNAASAFGFIIKNNENNKIQITDEKITAMRTEGEFGGFYTILRGIPYEKFNSTYTVTPYVTIGGRTYMGDDESVSVTNTDKWLGNISTMIKNHSVAVWEE